MTDFLPAKMEGFDEFDELRLRILESVVRKCCELLNVNLLRGRFIHALKIARTRTKMTTDCYVAQRVLIKI